MLTRRDKQTVTIYCPNGDEIVVLYRSRGGNQCTIGIEAPKTYYIERDELKEKEDERGRILRDD